MKLPATCI